MATQRPPGAGKRGPLPGFRQRQREEAAKAAQTGAATPLSSSPAPLSAADLENPNKLSGEALKALAHRHGLALSTLATMDDEKVRRELNLIINRQYSTEEA